MPDNEYTADGAIVGVRFHQVGKTYHFEANGIDPLAVGDYVVVETSRGREIGQVVQTGLISALRASLKPVKRRATAQDMALHQRSKLQEQEAFQISRQQVEELGLPVRIVRTEYNFDGRRLRVFFIAEEKTDLRPLRQALTRLLRINIELHALGAREFAKLMGGCGACGGPLCCATFLTEFAPVSIKAAKVQEVPLIPSEITGMCGRLRCCLHYEYETYRDAKQINSHKGRQVITPHGRGTITRVHPLKETAVVDFGAHQIELPLSKLQLEPREGQGNGDRAEKSKEE